MHEQPRPFESLEWFRESEQRPTFLSSHYTRRPLAWLMGLDALIFHVSLFAFVGVMLFAINLMRSPDALWISRLSLVWLILLLMHMAVLLLIRLIGMLRGEEARPLRPDVSWDSAQRNPAYLGPVVPRQRPEDASYRETFRLARPAASDEGHDTRANTVPSGSQTKDDRHEEPSAATPPVQAESPWTSWRTDEHLADSASSSSPEDRASWSEAARAAWLVHNDDYDTASSSSTEHDTTQDTRSRRTTHDES